MRHVLDGDGAQAFAGLMDSLVAHWRRTVAVILTAFCLSACSTRHFIVQGMADELASQSQLQEEDLGLARDASAFYLKLSEALLQEVPDNARLAESVASGFTQYAYAFVASEADKVEERDIKAALALRNRAAKLYLRAHRHAMQALERAYPGFRKALESSNQADLPPLEARHVGLAYWASAAWGGYISLSKDHPEVVADLPLAVRLAHWAYAKDARYGEGALASLMGTFETARPGGSPSRAAGYFDEAIALGAGHSAGPVLAKAEAIALPQGKRVEFEDLLQQSLSISAAHPSLANAVARERAQWLLGKVEDLF